MTDLRARAEELLTENADADRPDPRSWMDAADRIIRDLLAALPPDHAPSHMTGRYHKQLRVNGKNSADNWLSWLTDEEKRVAMLPEPTPPDPAPTGERMAWEDYGTTSRLAIPHGPTLRVYHSAADLTWRWYLDGEDVSPKNDPSHATKKAAQLAAESAAAELGLRARGCK